MSSGIYSATAGAVAQSTALDTTANNIANASTAGFRGDRVVFKEVLAKAKSPDLAMVSTGGSRIDVQVGTMMTTDNPLDLAIDGDGYFAIDTPAGVRYTRAGAFSLDDARRVVTTDGHPVRGGNGRPIEIPPDASAIAIAGDGTISADGVEVGQLELVKFLPTQLQREGAAMFAATGAPVAGDRPIVRSGVVEGSNVNVVRGVVDLVKVSRTYESLMRMIQAYHDVESRAARDLGSPK